MQDLKSCQNPAKEPDASIRGCTVFIRSRKTVDGRPLPTAALGAMFYLRGLAHLTKEESAAAISDFTSALIFTPDNFANYVFRSRAHVAFKNFSVALDDANRAVGGAKQTVLKVAAYNQRALIYFMTRDYDRELSDLNAALALNSQSGFTYFMRAEVYQILGQQEKANTDYALAIKFDPSNANTYAGYRELNRAWLEYLEDIQETDDYSHWDQPPLAGYRGSGGTPARAGQESCDLAVVHWKSTESIGTLAAYQDHLARFPNCAFATLARARIAVLTEHGATDKTGPAKTCSPGLVADSDGDCVRNKAGGRKISSHRTSGNAAQNPDVASPVLNCANSSNILACAQRALSTAPVINGNR